MEGLSSQIISRTNTTKKVALRDAPISINGRRASDVVIPQAQEAADWGAIAQAAAVIAPAALMPTELTPAINVDTPDNSDLTRSEAPRVQVNEQGQPMMYDARTDTWLNINLTLPGQGAPAPAAPAVDEKEKRKQLIAIFAISLLLLLVMLYFISKKK